jgi:glycosyltransferase involved in cell wall biosynthesis
MVVHAYYPLGETRVEREALALIDRGYAVDVVCLQDAGEPAQESVDGVTVYRLPVQRGKRRGQVFQLFEYLAFFVLASIKLIGLHWRNRYGVIQAHNLPDFLVFAAIGPKLLGARVILDLHDLMPEFYAARGNRSMTSWPVRLVIWQEQISCRFADHVITVTDIWRETLIRRGVPAGKVSVVMNVADTRIFQRSLVDEPSLSRNGSFRLIYHGTLTHRYGVDLILRALAQVRSAVPGIRLTLIGAGDALDDLQRLAEELGLGEQVEFSRELHAAHLPPLIAQADAGVVPNRNDPFTDTLLPTKLLEYVALGTPVIAARTQTIAAYFDDSMVKFFRPGDADDLANAILDLHTDRSLLVRLARNAGKFDEKYSWPQVSAQYAALVDRLNSRQTMRKP